MRKPLGAIALFVGALLVAGGGCAGVNEAFDCDQLCRDLNKCIDSDLDIAKCTDRCEDKVDSKSDRADLDSCTDCLDKGYACAEEADKCPICAEIRDRFID